MATGASLPVVPMLHFVAALPAEAQSVGSLQSESTASQSAPDKVVNQLPSLLLLATAYPLVRLLILCRRVCTHTRLRPPVTLVLN